jgi:glucosamine--fructose-6-phosphate aminotransferase (isomerizing)
MCGIVGVVGNGNAKEILLNGLSKLEYRGYDSAGIYVTGGAKPYLVKTQGRIQALRDKVSADVSGDTGIGHTRWATHGVPSVENAHPHTSSDGRFVLVHNGVIENFEELKAEYLAGDTLNGETDTEVAVHVIAHFAQTAPTTKAAFKQALDVIKGSYAFAMIDQEAPDTIYVAKNKSPLLIGLCEGYNVVCSDAMAMLNETNQFLEINDGELVVLTKTDAQIENKAGESITRAPFITEMDATDVEKGAYPFYMLKEIDEQPIVMRRLIQEYVTDHGTINFEKELVAKLAASDRIYIVACGTSNNAGWAGKATLEQLTQIPVEVHLSSEFGYNMPLLSKKPFFIFLSQSGETADSRQVLVKVNALGLPSLTMTNVAGSTLSREAEYTALLYGGPEIAVASTKAYTAQAAVLAFLAKAVGEAKGVPAAQAFDIVHELGLVANAMDVIINEKEYISSLVTKYLETTRNAFYIGRGVDYYVSMEAALKLKEISYIQAEGFAAGELKHGTIALIEKGTPVLGIITDPVTGPHTRGNLKEVESRGAATIVISSEEMSRPGDQLILPNLHPALRTLLSVVPTQLIAYYASLHRGYDVDKPRNLAKAVTVE